MSAIKAEVIAEFANTGRRLALTTATGTTPVVTKAETIDAAYGIGEALIVDSGGLSLVGPISATDARIPALKIIDGDEQAATHPMTLLFLATAVAAFATEPQPDDGRPLAEAPSGDAPQGRTAAASQDAAPAEGASATARRPLLAALSGAPRGRAETSGRTE